MTAQPQPARLSTGGRIDRSVTWRFTLDGREYTGHPGDTLASALLANGRVAAGNSLYEDRPRGIMSAGVDSYNGNGQRGSFHVIEHQMAAAVELFPIFARAHVLRTWGGIVDTTLDASPIVGTTPVENMFVNCGWGTGGFKGTPAAGLTFAHTIATGTPHELNKPFALERFETGALIDEHGAAAVAH